MAMEMKDDVLFFFKTARTFLLTAPPIQSWQHPAVQQLRSTLQAQCSKVLSYLLNEYAEMPQPMRKSMKFLSKDIDTRPWEQRPLEDWMPQFFHKLLIFHVCEMAPPCVAEYLTFLKNQPWISQLENCSIQLGWRSWRALPPIPPSHLEPNFGVIGLGHAAVARNEPGILRLLLNNGYNHRDEMADCEEAGRAWPIHLAAMYGHLPCLQLLCWRDQKSAHLNAKMQDNLTPLLCAVAHKRRDCVKFLLSLPAVDCNAVENHHGWSAMHYAMDQNDTELQELLVKHGATFQPLRTSLTKTLAMLSPYEPNVLIPVSSSVPSSGVEDLKETLIAHRTGVPHDLVISDQDMDAELESDTATERFQKLLFNGVDANGFELVKELTPAVQVEQLKVQTAAEQDHFLKPAPAGAAGIPIRKATAAHTQLRFPSVSNPGPAGASSSSSTSFAAPPPSRVLDARALNSHSMIASDAGSLINKVLHSEPTHALKLLGYCTQSSRSASSSQREYIVSLRGGAEILVRDSPTKDHPGNCLLPAIGTYDQLEHSLLRVVTGQQVELEQVLAQQLLLFAQTGTMPTEQDLINSGLLNVSQYLKQLQCFFFLVTIKEISRRLPPPVGTTERINALPFGLALLRALHLILLQKLRLTDVFSANARYGLATGRFVMSEGFEAAVEKMERINRFYHEQVIAKAPAMRESIRAQPYDEIAQTSTVRPKQELCEGFPIQSSQPITQHSV